MHTIKNVIFDLGGVLINLDPPRTAEALQRLYAPDYEPIGGHERSADWFRAFEVGQLSAPEFRARLRKRYGITAPDSAIDAAWNAMLLDLPPRRLRFVKKIGESKRVFLFSNTNPIHMDYIENALRVEHGVPDLSSFFEKDYYSHVLGQRKPNPEAFLAICEEQNLVPGETLFIDDTSEHIEGARRAGLQAAHLQLPGEVEELPVFSSPQFLGQ